MSLRLRAVLAWCVHLYTAMGLACAAGMAVLIVRGDPDSLRMVYWLMLLATLIDATDGALARLVKVEEALPGFDGRRLDDLVDFLTYVALPLLLIWRSQLLAEGTEAWLLLPLLASAYGFCQAQAKTDDGYFLGFPSCWNVVAFYLHFLSLTPVIRLALIVIFSFLTFVPLRYPYPSQGGFLNRCTLLFSIPWIVLVSLSLWQAPLVVAGSDKFAIASLYFPAWYLGATLWISLARDSASDTV